MLKLPRPKQQPKVTFTLTSANRLDLLKITVESFLKYNRYPIERYLLVDDSGVEGTGEKISQQWPFFEVTFNRPRLGQTASIDHMYSQVETEYIFHCEDDWEFTNYDFIDKSMDILTLSGNEKIIQVWIRGEFDTNLHPVLRDKKYKAENTEYYLLAANHLGLWGGFSFNPGLRRLSDYHLIAPYTSVGPATEIPISQKYMELGYRAATLISQYTKHTGTHRRIDRGGLI